MNNIDGVILELMVIVAKVEVLISLKRKLLMAVLLSILVMVGVIIFGSCG